MPTIEIQDVWKRFDAPGHGRRTLKETLVQALLPRRAQARDARDFWALKGINLAIERGETFGIIGSNGSGKSTLMKLITGISRPSRGTVAVHGRVSGLLELGAGFHPDFSGRENTFLNGAILGLRRKEIEEKFDSIVDFAEIGAFIDNPVKTYSSGMYMRLAFSIAIHVDPDILVIDEVLAVGDAAFQQKCFDQIQRFKHAGKTIVFVSHSAQAVMDLCQRAAWIEKGELRAFGKTEDVLEAYAGQVNTVIERQRELAVEPARRDVASLSNLQGYSAAGEETGLFEAGDEVHFGFDVKADMPQDLDLLVRVYRSDRIVCYDMRRSLAELTRGEPEGRLRLRIPQLRLHSGPHSLQLNLMPRGSDESLEERYFNFSVASPIQAYGVAPLDAEFEWLSKPVVR